MKINYNALPRGAGKTTQSVEQFKKDPDNSLLVVPNSVIKRYVSKEFGITKNIINSIEFLRYCQGRKFENFIFDEYDMYENKKEIYKHIHYYSVGTKAVFVNTTVAEGINKNLYSYVKSCKEKGVGLTQLIYEYKSNNPLATPDIDSKLTSLYFDFITDKNVVFNESFGEFNENLNMSDIRSSNSNKIRLEQLDPMGNVVETIELEGRWKITTGEKSYVMTNRYVDEMKVDLGKIQKNFMGNL